MEPWKRNLLGLWVAQFVAVMGVSLVMPFIPFYVRELGVQELRDVELWSGLIVSGPFILSSFMTPVWGALGDRHGRKLMVMRATLGVAAANALIGLATSPSQLLVLRLLQGGVSGFVSASLALMAAWAPRERMGFALGSLHASVSAGSVVGPLIGGVLGDLVGYRYVFFITASACLAATGLVSVLVTEKSPHPRQDEQGLRVADNYRLVLSSPELRAAFALLLASQAGVSFVQPVFALFVESLGVSGRYLSTYTGALFAVTGVAAVMAAPLWGRKGDKLGHGRVFGLAVTGLALSCGLQGLVTRPYQLFVLRGAQGAFVAGMAPAIFSMVGRSTPEERKGGVMGIMSSATLIANAVGPATGGVLSALIGLRVVFPAAALVLLATSYRAFRLKLGCQGPSEGPPGRVAGDIPTIPH
ncbi:MAG: MFS transporter [Firmicutes bacterium]|nr:MFS transporter [Bacillota bacterium]